MTDLLIFPRVDNDDIEQEVELLRLLGKRASRAILRKRAERSQALLFSDYLPTHAIPFTTADPLPAYETIEQLVEWAIEYGGRIQDHVLGFLDEPTDGGLADLLRLLEEDGIELHELEPIRTGTFAEVLRRYMSSVKVASWDDLYTLARNTHMTERPEATVRQLIRRLIRDGELEERDDGQIALV